MGVTGTQAGLQVIFLPQVPDAEITGMGHYTRLPVNCIKIDAEKLEIVKVLSRK